jgi:signal transduction histidine kinase
LVVDTRLQVRSANRAYYLAFGGTRETTEGVDLRELGEGAWADPDLVGRVKAVFADGREIDDLVVARRFAGIGLRSLHLGVKKVYRPGNHTGLVLIAIEDSTERDAAQARLTQVNAELEGFAYTVAHDLRAPLRALEGYSRALQEDFGDRLGAVARSYTESIAEAAARMDLLIRDLLDYSRLARSDVAVAVVSLDNVVSAAREQLAADLASRRAALAIEGPLGSVLAHFTTLVQVVVNLLSNAVKFIPPGTVPQVRVWSEVGPDRIRLWVEDNGIGIASDFHDRIFKVFERLHGQEDFAGTGIGLAIVRKGIERMGGTVGLESALGSGARFWIELAAADGHR